MLIGRKEDEVGTKKKGDAEEELLKKPDASSTFLYVDMPVGFMSLGITM